MFFSTAADVTTSFPANGKFSERQRNIYNGVLSANRAVIEALKPGIDWVRLSFCKWRL